MSHSPGYKRFDLGLLSKAGLVSQHQFEKQERLGQCLAVALVLREPIHQDNLEHPFLEELFEETFLEFFHINHLPNLIHYCKDLDFQFRILSLFG